MKSFLLFAIQVWAEMPKVPCSQISPSVPITLSTQGSFAATEPLVLEACGTSGWVQPQHRFTEYHKALLITNPVAISSTGDSSKQGVSALIKPYYAFSGPQPISSKLKCLKSSVCLVKLAWKNSTWSMEVIDYPSHPSRSPRHSIPSTIHAHWTKASSYIFKVHGPSNFQIAFNQISLCTKIATRRQCLLCHDIKNSCFCEKLYLPSGAPDGIAGLEEF
ncbi:hypothetical protein DSO57_1039247 [Entomophthora muscae]|uniref:Uncharacterized protein n=1 Tax=Entomophthora muscae TaxID=34485 RepID=A0ACC2SMF8_9FUNG|nr:hypothetical protein DSO57_1039247 [Entomophthora muscae]